MGNEIDELRSICKSQLTQIANLKNEYEKLFLEKHDLFKELINGIIDVIDIYDRVIDNIREKGLDSNDDAQKIISRFSNIQKKLLNVLQKYGITPIFFPENRIIIGWCKVIDTEVDSSCANDTIKTVLRSGYHRGKELIREADVIIVKN